MSESAIKKFFTKLAPSKSQIIDKGLCEILRKFSKNYNNKNEKKKTHGGTSFQDHFMHFKLKGKILNRHSSRAMPEFQGAIFRNTSW